MSIFSNGVASPCVFKLSSPSHLRSQSVDLRLSRSTRSGFKFKFVEDQIL
jgi:hypothetical protein